MRKAEGWGKVKGKVNEYKSDDVKAMIEDIYQFLSENLQLKNMK